MGWTRQTAWVLAGAKYEESLAQLAASLLLHLLESQYSSWGPLAHSVLRTGVLDLFNMHAMTRHAACAWSGPVGGMLQSDATVEKSRRGRLCETNVFFSDHAMVCSLMETPLAAFLLSA